MSNLQKYILNGSSVWTGSLTKTNGRPAEHPARFVIRPLSRNDAESMGKLSAEIYRHLNSGEECFIHKHEKEYYHQVFNNPDIRYIGVFAGRNLIGMSYLRICRNEKSFADEIPGCPVNFFKNRPGTQIAAFGADCVSPQYRGNSLNQIMIAYRLEQAASLGCSNAFSIVDRSNHWNMPPYFNNGFHMFAAAVDPSDGGQIALMRHNLASQKSRPVQHGIAIPFNRFKIIDTLLAKGFIGTGYNKEAAAIMFVPTSRSRQALNRSLTAVITQNKGAHSV